MNVKQNDKVMCMALPGTSYKTALHLIQRNLKILIKCSFL